MMEKTVYRALMEYLVSEGLSPTEIYTEMVSVLKESYN